MPNDKNKKYEVKIVWTGKYKELEKFFRNYGKKEIKI